MPVALIPNAAGRLVAPRLPNIQAAVEQSTLPADMRSMTVNAPGERSYPLTGLTWVLVCEQMRDKTQATALVDFLYWALNSPEAANATRALDVAPLPSALRDRAVSRLLRVQVNGERVLNQSADPTRFSPRDLATQITGSGATFPDPVYQRWIALYAQVAPDIEVT